MNWAMDAKGSIIHRSRDWLEFTGLGERDARSQVRSKAVHPDDYATVEQIIKQALSLQAPFLLTCRLRRGGNDYAWVLAGGTPALAPVDGSFLGYMGATEQIRHPADVSRVANLLHMPGIPRTKRSVLLLDAMANHIMAARTLAERNGDASVARTLDFALIMIGDLLYRAVDQRASG